MSSDREIAQQADPIDQIRQIMQEKYKIIKRTSSPEPL